MVSKKQATETASTIRLALFAIWVLLVIAYVIWPIDLIPDIIPIIGWIDDLVLIVLTVLIATKVIK